MPILTLQKRVRELGRIRIGVVVPTDKGKTRPEKLDRFRFTSASKELLGKVAALYGGTVQAWTPANGGTPQWEVVTTATRLPILVPPQPVTQWYETWSGGGAQRRCDGEREVLTDAPCLCDPDPIKRMCKPTTRLNVVLKDVEGIGVWRLESHGYYAAMELPEAAELLARAGGYISGWLGLEARTAKREGKTRNWMTPILEIDISPAALLAGGLPTAPTIAASVAGPALPAGVRQDDASLLAAIASARSLDALREVYAGARDSGFVLTPEMQEAFEARASELAEAAGLGAAEERLAIGGVQDATTLWQQVLAAAPEDWSTEDVEDDFAKVTSVAAADATAEDMAAYLTARAS